MLKSTEKTIEKICRKRKAIGGEKLQMGILFNVNRGVLLKVLLLKYKSFVYMISF